MAKTLELRVEANVTQAMTAMSWFRNKIWDTALAQDHLTETQKEEARVMGVSVWAYRRATNELTAYQAAMNRASLSSVFSMSNISQAARKTGEQLMSIVKYAGMFAVISGWMIAGKAFNDLSKFSEKFGLMNATLKAKMPENISILKHGLIEMAATTWVEVWEITDALTQLYSTGFSPTAKEGTAEYTKQLKESLNITERVTLASKALGEWTETLTMAAIGMWNSFWIDVKTTAGMNYVLGLMGASLDLWAWKMSQYSWQFAKFAKDWKNANRSTEESMGIFTRFTKSMGSAQQAGLLTSSFAKMFSNTSGQRWQYDRKLKALIEKPGATKYMTAGDVKMLKSSVDTWQYAKMFMNPDGTKREFTDVMNQLSTQLSKYQSPLAKDTFMAGLFPNARQKKAFMDLASKEGSEDLKKIIAKIKQDSSSTDAMDEKIAITQNTFWAQMKRMSNAASGQMILMADAISPAIGAFADLVSQAFSAVKADPEQASRAFDAARMEIEKINPALKGVVDKMEQFYNFLVSDKGQKTLQNIWNAFLSIWDTLVKVGGAIATVVGSEPFQILLQALSAAPILGTAWLLFGWNLIKGAMWWIGTWLMSWLAAKLWPAWLAMAASFGAAVLALGIWALIGAAIYQEMKSASKKDLESTEKNAEASKTVAEEVKQSKEKGYISPLTLQHVKGIIETKVPSLNPEQMDVFMKNAVSDGRKVPQQTIENLAAWKLTTKQLADAFGAKNVQAWLSEVQKYNATQKDKFSWGISKESRQKNTNQLEAVKTANYAYGTAAQMTMGRLEPMTAENRAALPGWPKAYTDAIVNSLTTKYQEDKQKASDAAVQAQMLEEMKKFNVILSGKNFSPIVQANVDLWKLNTFGFSQAPVWPWGTDSTAKWISTKPPSNTNTKT